MINFENEKPLTYENLLKIENIIYEKEHINNEVKASKVNVDEILKRKIEIFNDKTFNLPQNIFYINEYKGRTIVGRKIRSVLSFKNKINAIHCSMITSSMILGILECGNQNGNNVTIEYYPFTKSEKITVFDEIKSNQLTDIYFPFKYLDYYNNEEEKSPSSGWDLNPEKVIYLGYGEEHIRKYTVGFLKKYMKDVTVVFDPACSTGQFLHTIKEHYPSYKTIGQDLSKEMVEYAKDYVDEIYCGDAINTIIPDESVDIMFLRFLNSEVVTTEYAHKLFDKLYKKVKKNGLIIAFGHTPLLIEIDYFKKIGLKVEQSIAYDKEYDCIFQYYVLRR